MIESRLPEVFKSTGFVFHSNYPNRLIGIARLNNASHPENTDFYNDPERAAELFTRYSGRYRDARGRIATLSGAFTVRRRSCAARVSACGRVSVSRAAVRPANSGVRQRPPPGSAMSTSTGS
jgi:predicted RNA-binding protein with PUA-like domain